MNKAILLSLMIATVALAGCTDEPPAGSFTATTPSSSYSAAGIQVTATPASNGYPNSQGEACDADQASENIPGAPTCSDATSTVALLPEGGVVLPSADSNTGYSLFLIDREGNEVSLGDMEDHGASEGGNHYDFPATEFPGQDFTGATEVQMRFGETIVATAPGNGGDFSLAQGLVNITADVTFNGAQIDVALTGVPANTPLVAWLVDNEVDEETGEETGNQVHSVQFLLNGDQTSYTLTEAEGFVGDYESFHIHVGASKINVAVAPIVVTTPE